MNLSAITSSSINLIDQPAVFDLPIMKMTGNPFEKQFNSSDHSVNASTASEAEQLVSQIDQLFGYRKNLNANQKKQVNRLFEKIDNLLQTNANSGPSNEQQAQLDKLFDEIDEIYQARSYESLSDKEQQMADRLLDQLDVSLA